MFRPGLWWMQQAIVWGVCVLTAGAAWADNAQPTGTWQLQITAEGASFAPILKLSKEGEQWKGSFRGDDGIESEVTETSLDGDQMCFTLTRDFGGQQLVAKYCVKVSGDKLSGTVDYDIGGQTGQATVEGERKLPNLAGKWNLVATSPEGQTFEPTMLLRQSGDVLSGKYLWIDGSEVDVTDGKVTNDEASFKVTLDFGGQKLAVTFHGAVDGDRIQGQADYDLEGQSGTVDFEGTRDTTTANVGGKWKLVANSPDGQTLEPSLELKQEGSLLSGKYTWIDGTQVDISEGMVNGSVVTFKVKFDMEGQELGVLFNTVASGDKLLGQADYDLAGQTGSVDVVGTREAAGSAAAGTWNFTLSMEDGQTAETSLELTQEGETLKGQYRGPLGEAEVTDAKLEGDQLSFSVTRERDGVEVVTTYQGKVTGDMVEGTVAFKAGDREGNASFSGKRTAQP